VEEEEGAALAEAHMAEAEVAPTLEEEEDPAGGKFHGDRHQTHSSTPEDTTSLKSISYSLVNFITPSINSSRSPSMPSIRSSSHLFLLMRPKASQAPAFALDDRSYASPNTQNVRFLLSALYFVLLVSSPSSYSHPVALPPVPDHL